MRRESTIRLLCLLLIAAPLGPGCNSNEGGPGGDGGPRVERSPIVDLAPDPCAGQTCSGQGTCAVANGAALCACNEGYHAVQLTCMPNDPGNPCNGVDCSGHGTCAPVSGKPLCTCDAGYQLTGATTCLRVGGPEAGVDGPRPPDAKVDGPKPPDASITPTCPTNADDLALELAKIVCAQNVKCCSGLSSNQCVSAAYQAISASVFPLKAAQASLDAKNSEIDCATLAACAKALAASSCATWPQGGFDNNLVCIQAIKGNLPLGATCSFHLECASRLCRSTCLAFRQAGQSCDHSNSSTKEICQPGLSCVSNVCQAVARPGLGETCTPPAGIGAGNCQTGLDCNKTTLKCEWKSCSYTPYIPSCSLAGPLAATLGNLWGILAVLGAAWPILRRRSSR